MFATLFSVTLLLAVIIRGVLADLTIDTIDLIQCEEAHISWTQGTPPYDLAVVLSDDPCGDVLAYLGSDHEDLSMSWNVTIPSGTNVTFSLLDSAGSEAWSGGMIVSGSGDSSCLPPSTSTSTSSSDSTSMSSTPTITPTTPSILPTDVASKSTSTSATTTTFSPAGAANAGLDPTSGAMTIRPLGTLVSIGSGLLALVAYVL